MTGTRFYKMTGSGNDFVMVDGRRTTLDEWPAERIVAICDRRTGVGADGLVILSPAGASTVRMTFFNSDGSRADMCGNAALCSTRLAAAIGLGAAEGMTLETDAGPVRTRCLRDPHAAAISLNRLRVPAPVPALELEHGELWACFGTVGVPHLVVAVDDLESIDLMRRGRALRFAPELGPAGANVNFIAPGVGGAPWLIRTYERGVEGETLACGTGTVAAALALVRYHGATLPLRFRTRGGPILGVEATVVGDEVSEAWLHGEGRLVFTGELPG